MSKRQKIMVLIACVYAGLASGGLAAGEKGRTRSDEKSTIPPATFRQKKRPALSQNQRLLLSRQPREKDRRTGQIYFQFTDGQHHIPARVRIVDPRGKIVGALPGLDWLWLDGKYDTRLVAGPVNVTVTRGPRSLPFRGVIYAKADKDTYAHLPTPPTLSVAEAGWLMFDPYLNANAKPRLPTYFRFSTLDEVVLAARAEGLNAVGVANEWQLLSRADIPFAAHTDGMTRLKRERQQLQQPGFSLLSAWRDGDATRGYFYAIEKSPPPLKKTRRVADAPFFQAFAEIHDRGGLAIYANPTGQIDDLSTGQTSSVAGELAFDLLAGANFDGIDISRGGDDLELWQRLLSRGYRLPALGGGFLLRRSPGIDIPALGCYVRPGGKKPTGADWLAAVREGRIVVSNGPFIQVEVDGNRLGEVIPASPKRRVIFIEALACADQDDSIARVTLIYNGKVIQQVRGLPGQTTLQIRLRRRLPQSGWLVARYYSRNRKLWAITNPIYIAAPETSSPPILLAKTTIILRDAATGKALAGTVETVNLGVRMQTKSLADSPTILLVPPTAYLYFQAAGYEKKKVSLYEAGGIRSLLDGLRKKNKLSAALLDGTIFALLKNRLQGVLLTVELKSKTKSK